jgi:aldehyde:ferredoxin oxidoreductase
MGSKYGGYMGKVLRVDLTTGEIGEYPWTDEDRALYLGGKIMAARILYDNLQPDTEAFAPENPLVVSTGPLSGTGAPCTSRFNVSALSPLTGLVASSNCGGEFGLYLKKAGYDAVVIIGKSQKPVWLEIAEDKVTVHDGADLWGKTTSETQAALGGKAGRLVIGPAGENLVRYAALFSGERAAGRAGLGAVMGSKNLKAIVASGTRKVEVKQPEKAKRVCKKWVKGLLAHPLTGRELPKYGTGFLLRRMQDRRVLATRNFKYGQFAEFDKVSGQTLAEKHLIKNSGCVTCPIQCGRVVELNGKLIKGPELETLGLLGPNLDNSDLDAIIRWNYQLDELGMDTMSTGGVIAFAMELQEKGLWNTGIEFGKTDNLPALFEDIAYRRGIGDLLAEGTRRLADKFGGKEFAMNVKGLELAAYEPRGAVGHGLGYAVANRGGCHLNSGYLVLLEGLALRVNPYATRSKAALNVMFQNLMEGVSAAGCCLFPLFMFTPGWLIDHPTHFITKCANALMLFSGGFINWFVNYMPAAFLPIHLPGLPHTKALSAVMGVPIRLGTLKDIGERGYNLERLTNIRMGLTEKDDSLPKRLTDELQIEGDDRTRVPLSAMKQEYYRIRGWDSAGVPTERKRRRLKLA